jgi:hypothetical protein
MHSLLVIKRIIYLIAGIVILTASNKEILSFARIK